MLETIVAERLDLAALSADEVVMVVAARLRRLIVSTPGPQLEAMHEPELGQGLKRAVDARNADPAPPPANEIVDLLDRQAAGLVAERLDDGSPRLPRLEAGPA